MEKKKALQRIKNVLQSTGLSYRDVFNSFKSLSKFYGGFFSILISPYFHVSIVITLFCYGFWTKPNWWETVFQVSPNILGFVLGGYAILLSFGNKKFIELIGNRDKKNKISSLQQISGKFTHFIIMQFFATIFAILAKSLYTEPHPLFINLCNSLSLDFACINEILLILFWGFSFLIFIYSLSLSVATTFVLLVLIDIFDSFIAHFKNNNNDK